MWEIIAWKKEDTQREAGGSAAYVGVGSAKVGKTSERAKPRV